MYSQPIGNTQPIWGIVLSGYKYLSVLIIEKKSRNQTSYS